MDDSSVNMHISPGDDFGIYREERFRVPTTIEMAFGLWVDRIGRRRDSGRPSELRILGQYAHVQILDGRGVYLSAPTGCIEVSAGDCMLVFPDEPCIYYPHGTWTTCWVTWNGEEGRVLENTGLLNRRYAVLPNAGDAVIQAYSRLVKIMHDESAAAALRRKTLALEMIERAHASCQQLRRIAESSSAMRRITAWLNEHYSEPLTVAGIATVFGMSVSNFRKCFTTYCGRSPSDYICEIRMVEARRLLREGLPVKNVAATVGYADIFHFMRVFKRRTGMTTGEFKRISAQVGTIR